MNRKQIFAILSPIIVILVMYPIFQLLSMAFHNNWRIGWFLGLMIYWLSVTNHWEGKYCSNNQTSKTKYKYNLTCPISLVNDSNL